MDAQLRTQDDSARPKPSGYGSVTEGLPNGVAEPGRPSEVSEAVTASVSLENPNLHDPAPALSDDRTSGPATTPVQVEARQVQVEPPYGVGPDVQMGVRVEATEAVQHAMGIQAFGDRASPTTPTSATVRVQEFYTAEDRSATGSPEQTNVRWTTRLTEFLRTTANRSFNGVDRFLDNIGFP